MKYITEKEEARLRRALDISAYDDEEAMAILQNIITEKNAEIVQKEPPRFSAAKAKASLTQFQKSLWHEIAEKSNSA